MILRCSSCATANRVPAERLHEVARCGRCKTELAPLAMPLPIHSAVEFDELVGSTKLPMLVDFWAQWCGPCHTVAPQLASVAKKRRGALIVAKLDTDEVPVVAARFGIRSIPTMILFSGGREAKRVTGAMPAAAIEQGLSL